MLPPAFVAAAAAAAAARTASLSIAVERRPAASSRVLRTPSVRPVCWEKGVRFGHKGVEPTAVNSIRLHYCMGYVNEGYEQRERKALCLAVKAEGATRCFDCVVNDNTLGIASLVVIIDQSASFAQRIETDEPANGRSVL